MPFSNIPDIWSIVGAFIISTISACISIGRRIIQGHPASLLWVITEFLAAILSGYLMWEAYPYLHPDLPEWLTMPMAIAVAAHVGGRLFQGVEEFIITRYRKYL